MNNIEEEREIFEKDDALYRKLLAAEKALDYAITTGKSERECQDLQAKVDAAHKAWHDHFRGNREILMADKL